MTLEEKIAKLNVGPKYQREKPNTVPESLTGPYLKHIGITPDREGVVTLDDRDVTNMLTGEDLYGYDGTAFNLGDIDLRAKNIPSEYQAFIDKGASERMAQDYDMPLSHVQEYLKGHELRHAKYMTPNIGIGNKGYMPTATNSFDSPSGMERWLDYGYSGEAWRKPQERLAHVAGIRRLNEKMKLMEVEPRKRK